MSRASRSSRLIYIMPTYEFKDKETGESKELFMKISEKDQFLKDNPNLKQVILPANFITRRDGDVLKKAGAGWNEVLQKVGEHHPGSEVARKNVRRTSKQVATDKVAQKHGIKDV